MNKKDSEKIKKFQQPYCYFLNLYKYGCKPFWTMHDTPDIAEADAKGNTDILHVAIPIHKDWINKLEES